MLSFFFPAGVFFCWLYQHQGTILDLDLATRIKAT
jgi:hypothetical protein